MAVLFDYVGPVRVSFVLEFGQVVPGQVHNVQGDSVKIEGNGR